MGDIDNTTERMQEPVHAWGFLLDSLAADEGRAPNPIESMEKAGQQQLVNSDRLPTDRRQDGDEFAALGFTFGEPDPRDPMFCPATLPEGWKREASDHDMWSHIVDQHGRQRVAIFYKAAFYDRSAFMRLESVDGYVIRHVEYDGPLVITDEWATREAVLAAMASARDEELSGAAKWRGYAADESGRDAGNRARCAEHAAEAEATAVKYEAAITAMQSQDAGQ